MGLIQGFTVIQNFLNRKREVGYGLNKKGVLEEGQNENAGNDTVDQHPDDIVSASFQHSHLKKCINQQRGFLSGYSLVL